METIVKLAEPFRYHFCKRRMRKFQLSVRPAPEESILDVGGSIDFWLLFPPVGKCVDLLIVYRVQWPQETAPDYCFRIIQADGHYLPFKNREYEIIFSNSTIEHVQTWANQKRFAEELRRVGNALWVQTPSRSFFFDSHYMTPFIHYFPKSIRRLLLRNFTLWGWLYRPEPKIVEASIEEHRLLSYREMKELFPDCKILKERFLFFTKSYIAYRPRQA